MIFFHYKNDFFPNYKVLVITLLSTPYRLLLVLGQHVLRVAKKLFLDKNCAQVSPAWVTAGCFVSNAETEACSISAASAGEHTLHKMLLFWHEWWWPLNWECSKTFARTGTSYCFVCPHSELDRCQALVLWCQGALATHRNWYEEWNCIS